MVVPQFIFLIQKIIELIRKSNVKINILVSSLIPMRFGPLRATFKAGNDKLHALCAQASIGFVPAFHAFSA